jgi:vitamin B12 transporter
MTYPVAPRRIPAGKPLALVSALLSIFPLVTIICPSVAQAQAAAAQTVLVTATRVPTPASEIIADHEVITAEEIALAGDSSLAQLLQKKRGIEIASNGGPGANASVFIRGANTQQNVVLVDGVRVGASTTGGATWSTIPLSQIDHIEIVYGPLSSLYGADAIGGVVQVFTKKGGAYLSPTASIGFGSKATRSQEAGISGSSAGEHAVHFAISAAHTASDGFSAAKPGAGPYTYNADKDGYDRDSASGQVSVLLAPGHELGASLLQSRLASQFDAGPGFDDRSVEKLENTSLYSKNQFVKGWNSTLQLSRSADKNATQASYGPSQFDTTQTTVNWQNDISLGPDLLQVVLEHRKEAVDASEPALVRERTTKSYALAYQLKRGAQLATASIRNDDSSQYGNQTTGSVAYGYRLTGALRFSASAGTSFRAPAFNELYYPQYGVASNKPERGRNAEIGVVYDDGRSQLSASYYHNRISDLLVFVPVCPVDISTHDFGCAYNVNQALLTGLSLGAATSYQHFSVRGALDLQDPRDETTDKRLARRAKRHGTLALEYTAGAFKGGVESVFSSQRFDDAANGDALAGYGLLNFTASYAVTRDWSVFGRWNNATNKDYELARNYATIGSNLFVGVRYGSK